VASLLKQCCYTATLTPSDTDTSATPNIDVSLRSSATKTNNPTSTMCQKFNIRTPGKAALVMEIVGEMKSPEKAPVRRQLLGGNKSNNTILEQQNQEIHSRSPMSR
jgi:hypothetical protein